MWEYDLHNLKVNADYKFGPKKNDGDYHYNCFTLIINIGDIQSCEGAIYLNEEVIAFGLCRIRGIWLIQ